MSEIANLLVEKAKASYQAVYLLSSEDIRSTREAKTAATSLHRRLFTWTLGKGVLEDIENAKVKENTDTPNGLLEFLPKLPEKSLIVLRLFHHFMEDPFVQSQLIDILPKFKETKRMLVILSPVLKLPAELEKEFALIDSPLPDKETLGTVLDGIVSASGMEALPTELKDRLVANAQGLTTTEAENAFALALVRPAMRGQGRTWDPTVVMAEKCATLKKSGLLQYYPPGEVSLGNVGGMSNYKTWIRRRKRAFTDEARAFGLRAPKGVLLVGIPGTGKSLAAKATAEELGVPLLRCDMGRIYAGLVGQSEENVRKVIQIAEAVSPCVLWLDEIEKGLSGAKAGGLDSGVGARVFGTFLTWMQEKKSNVFIFATANDVKAMPPELLRKGRFDEIFSVTLPTHEERKEIFRIHVTGRGRERLLGDNPECNLVGPIDVDLLAGRTPSFSGSEIESVIEEALYTAFANDKDLNLVDLLETIDNVVPLAVMMQKEIEAIEAWCAARTRPAGESESSSKELANSVLNAQTKLGGRVLDA